MLVDAIREAFTEVRAAHAKETFYVFALFSENGDDLQPTCNTLEGLARTANRLAKPEDELRWFAEEFAYHQAGEAHFAGIGAQKSLRPAVTALQKLEAEGFFGEGKARSEVAVLVLRSDQANREVVEIARKLNPPAVWARIEAAFPLGEATGVFETWPGKAVYALDALAVSADRRLLAGAGWFGGSELVLYRDGAALKVKKPKEAYRHIAFAGTSLLGATKNGVEKDGKPFLALRDCQAMVVLGDELVVSTTKEVTRWSVATGTKLDASTPALYPLAVTTGGIAGISEKGILVVGKASKALRDPRARQIAACRDRIAIGSYDHERPIRVFDGVSESFTLSARPARGVTDLAFSPNGKRLAAANEDGHVRVWDLAKRKLILDVRGRQESMNAAIFLSDDRVAAAGRDVARGPPVYIWTIPD